MEIKTLKYFVEIADQKSMRKAADRLYVTQPNLTRAIQNLEEEMGEQLFRRTNHGVRLTTMGESLYFYAQAVLSQLQEIDALRQHDKEFQRNKLGVSVGGVILADALMLEFYRTLETRHANISIHETTIEQVLEHVAGLESEMGILSVNHKQLAVLKKIADIKELEVHEIAGSPLYAHVGPENPYYHQQSITPDKLLPHTYIRLQEDYFANVSNLLILGGGIRVSDFQKSIVINNYHAIVNMVKRTDAFIFGGDWQKEELAKGGIASILMEACEVEKKLVWVKRKKEIFSTQAELFLSIVLGYYGR